MTGAIVAGSALLGLVVGSFLNVVVYRVPAGKSVIHPPSACPNCGTPIQPRDNVPVLSWLLLRGRCRQCGNPISIRYPLVEAATAAAFGATAAVVELGWTLPAFLWFVGLTLALAIVDFDTKKLPNRMLLPGTVVAVALLAVGAAVHGAWWPLARAMMSGAGFFGVLLLIALAVPAGFGMGDVKLGFVLGVFTGFVSWGSAIVGFFLAFFIGGLVALVLLATRRVGRKTAIPFGPYLVAGSWLAVAFGEAIFAWYLS